MAVAIHKLSTNITINSFNGVQIDDKPLKRLSPARQIFSGRSCHRFEDDIVWEDILGCGGNNLSG